MELNLLVALSWLLSATWLGHAAFHPQAGIHPTMRWWMFAVTLVLVVLFSEGVADKCDCVDVEPRDSDPCIKQREYGNCKKTWLLEGGYCAKSCDRCQCTVSESDIGCLECNNDPPNDEFTCEEQKQFGKCNMKWMQPFCNITCGRCSCPPTALADEDETEKVEDVAPWKERKEKLLVQNKGTHLPPVTEAEPQSTHTSDSWLQSAAVPGDFLNPEVGFRMDSSARNVSVLAPHLKNTGQECSKTVLDVLTEGQGFGIFVDALEATGLAETLDNPENSLGVFAPDDKAFAHFFNAFGLSAEEFLTKHLGKAKAILQYHIVPNIDSPETLTDSAVPLDTLLGSKKLFAAGKSAVESLASSAKVLSDFIFVCDSTILIVDSILLPAPSLQGIKSSQALKSQFAMATPSIGSLPSAGATAPAATTPIATVPCTNDGNLMDVIAADPDLSLFAEALVQAKVSKDLERAEITAFAPTNVAFTRSLQQMKMKKDDLFSDMKQLKSLLQYHLVAGNYDGQTMTQMNLVTLNTKPLFVEVLPYSIEIAGLGNSARVTEIDVDQQCNAALHKIDTLLLPFPVNSTSDIVPENSLHKGTAPGGSLQAPGFARQPQRACLSVADVFASHPLLKILNRAILSSGLYPILSDKSQKVTFFAPTDNSFVALAQSKTSLPILTNPAALKSILGYQALRMPFELEELKANVSYPTLILDNGEPIGITVLRDNSVPKGIVLKGVEGLSTIVQEDIVACDSIVHVVDGVLLPAAAIAEIGSKSSKGTSIVRSG